MKLSLYAVALSYLWFFIPTSNADMVLKKCQSNQNDYIVFDEYDVKIVLFRYLLMKIAMIEMTG